MQVRLDVGTIRRMEIDESVYQCVHMCVYLATEALHNLEARRALGQGVIIVDLLHGRP